MIFSNPAGAPELACDECGCRWFDRMANRCYECGAEVSAEAMDAYRDALAAFCDARDGRSLQSVAHDQKDRT
jgi:DNA-directed RNA polymerase subunit RPC12/RpoP